MKISLSNHVKGILITALGVIVISPDGLLTRLITEDTLTIVFWRCLFYSLGMLVLLLFYYKTKFMDALFKIGIPGLWMVVLYFFGNLLFIYSITHTAVANTLFIMSTTPFWAALITWLVFKEKVAMRTWVAIGVAGAGIGIICASKSIMPDAYLGNMAGLLATATLATSFTIVARNRDRDLLPSFVVAGFATAIILEPFIAPSTVSDINLGYLFIMGFMMLPIGASLMFIGPRYVSAPEVGLLMLLESIFGPIWVWMVLDEYPGDMVVAGGVIVLTTLLVHAWLGMRSFNKKFQVKEHVVKS